MGELRPSGAGLAGCGAQAGCCLQEQLLLSVPSICKFLDENLLYRDPNSKHHSCADDKNFCSLEAGLIPPKRFKVYTEEHWLPGRQSEENQWKIQPPVLGE